MTRCRKEAAALVRINHCCWHAPTRGRRPDHRRKLVTMRGQTLNRAAKNTRMCVAQCPLSLQQKL